MTSPGGETRADAPAEPTGQRRGTPHRSNSLAPLSVSQTLNGHPPGASKADTSHRRICSICDLITMQQARKGRGVCGQHYVRIPSVRDKLPLGQEAMVRHDVGSCACSDARPAQAHRLVSRRITRRIWVATLAVAAQLANPVLATRGLAVVPGMSVVVTVSIGGATGQWTLTAPAPEPSTAAATAVPSETLAVEPATTASTARTPDAPMLAPTSVAPQPVTTAPVPTRGVTPAATSAPALGLSSAKGPEPSTRS